MLIYLLYVHVCGCLYGNFFSLNKCINLYVRLSVEHLCMLPFSFSSLLSPLPPLSLFMTCTLCKHWKIKIMCNELS